MDKDLLVQNIIRYCTVRGEPPTVACVNAGLGKDFLSDIKRGRTPSVAKVADMATYLEVSTSDLVGDNVSNSDTKKEPAGNEADELSKEFSFLIRHITPEQRELVKRLMQDMLKEK